MKILIVEDDAGYRDTLRDILELNGHEVLAAEDGEQGLALAAQSPEFIFCDVEMPKLDGHGVLAGVKQLPGVCDVPFVFLTGRSERDQLRQGMSLGADDYITKPYTQADILAAIAARTKRHHGLREKIQALAQRHEQEIHAQWSHELLTPLNAVLGSLDLLEGEAQTIDRAELKEFLGLIREGAERQERLARKLIAYFSLEQQVNSPLRSAGRCAADAAIANGAGRGAKTRKREGDVAISAAAAEVALSEQWLALAVAEAVENAAAFSSRGSPIKVSGAVSNQGYRIAIIDQGPGLTPDHIARIGAFTQFDRKKHEQQGLGLGLAICRLAMRLSGGELKLGAGPGGRGLQVDLLVPLAGLTA